MLRTHRPICAANSFSLEKPVCLTVTYLKPHLRRLIVLFDESYEARSRTERLELTLAPRLISLPKVTPACQAHNDRYYMPCDPFARDGTYVRENGQNLCDTVRRISFFSSSAGRRESALSRFQKIDKSNPDPHLGKEPGFMTQEILAVFGAAAPTAVAYCALDAWMAGEKTEFKELANLFQKLKN
ncbi:hypothetical protein [Rhizobium glycinendophyticum]|uniref:Uncharacterized protein n=1 Tax=Rhizobium glycinendophyticum TaxID=2589807 RepID=A0A504UHT3_9HYPH|nr:hypothetical protein [Rhizobium glycinendophyticum]TPP04583.1 hypothetical protein FJQ55_21965 [Rhizobium glycinendophyticum]